MWHVTQSWVFCRVELSLMPRCGSFCPSFCYSDFFPVTQSGRKPEDVQHVQPQLSGILQWHLQADWQAASGVPRRLQRVHQPDVPAGDGRQWGREASPWTVRPGRQLRGQIGGWYSLFFFFPRSITSAFRRWDFLVKVSHLLPLLRKLLCVWDQVLRHRRWPSVRLSDSHSVMMEEWEVCANVLPFIHISWLGNTKCSSVPHLDLSQSSSDDIRHRSPVHRRAELQF